MKSGHVRWPAENPVWEFDYWLADSPQTEGTVFYRVYYKGRLVLWKASVPMIRVQYDNGTIYKDQLCANNLTSFNVYEGSPGPGYRFLVVDASHRIGQYRLTNRWIFRDDGVILPQMYSAGLQHPVNHRHHVYWRLDFDIDGRAGDLALWKVNSWPQDWGYGPGWYPITAEESFRKSDMDRAWAVMNKGNGMGYLVIPGPFDGKNDSFSRGDLWVARYRGEEDLHGLLGSAASDDLKLHLNHENTDGQDIVLWYAAHLGHVAADHGDEWHVCGPILKPFGY